MKSKAFSKKLKLNKKTLINLNNNAMSKVLAGETGITCQYCDSNESCIVTNCDWEESVYTGCYCTEFSCGINRCDFNSNYTNCCY